MHLYGWGSKSSRKRGTNWLFLWEHLTHPLSKPNMGVYQQEKHEMLVNSTTGHWITQGPADSWQYSQKT